MGVEERFLAVYSFDATRAPFFHPYGVISVALTETPWLRYLTTTTSEGLYLYRVVIPLLTETSL